jgi:phospholipase D-like protein
MLTKTDFAFDRIWSRITSLTNKSTRNHVAVAYLSPLATGLLPLKKDDVLVVDMSIRAAKSSQTDPREIRKYKKAGVRVYWTPKLHAKVFVLGDKVVVGSTNVSKKSNEYLQEAAIIKMCLPLLKRRGASSTQSLAKRSHGSEWSSVRSSIRRHYHGEEGALQTQKLTRKFGAETFWSK